MIGYFHDKCLTVENPLMHSSVFKILFVESLDEISEEDRKKPKYQWFFEDVPLWAYYNHAESGLKEGEIAIYEEEVDFCDENNICIDCYELLWDCEC